MTILSMIIVLPIIFLLVMPMWHIVGLDFWNSVILADENTQKMHYPWALTLLGPIIMSAICVGIAHLVGFNTWLALSMCIMCVLMAMMGGLTVLYSKKDAECSIWIVILYFAVFFALMGVFGATMENVGELMILGWI